MDDNFMIENSMPHENEKPMELLERIDHFEKNQLKVGDEYGAEVLYRAKERIRELQAERDALVQYIKTLEPAWHGEEWIRIPVATRKEIEAGE